MKTKCEINVDLDMDNLFTITNDVENWPRLFSNYSKVDILDKSKNYVKFRLYYKENDGSIVSWISERTWKVTDKEIQVTAKRLDPILPYKYMNIIWKYRYLGKNKTKMIWEQEFEISDLLPKDKKERLIKHLISSPQNEIKLVKNNAIKVFEK